MYAVKLGFCPSGIKVENEQIQRLHLPDDYAKFIALFNGGMFDQPVGFHVLDADDDLEVGKIMQFYGIWAPDDVFDLRNTRKIYGFDAAVPQGYLPIGHNFSLNQVCIALSGPNRGEVLMWSPGIAWPDEPEPTTEYLHPIASNFRDFWEGLFELED